MLDSTTGGTDVGRYEKCEEAECAKQIGGPVMVHSNIGPEENHSRMQNQVATRSAWPRQ